MRKKNEGQLRFQFNESSRYDPLEYEDKLPEGVSEEDDLDEIVKVVWCEYTE